MQVIKHPIQTNCWTILKDGKIYGCFDRYALAVAVMCGA